MLRSILKNRVLMSPVKLVSAADLSAASLLQAGLRNICRNKMITSLSKVQSTAILCGWENITVLCTFIVSSGSFISTNITGALHLIFKVGLFAIKECKERSAI